MTRAERAGKPTDASLLSAAYHNLAVQQERLGNKKGHVRSYRAAVLQARKGTSGGGKSQMTNFMEQAYSHARQRANQPGGAPAQGAGAQGAGAQGAGGQLPPVRISRSSSGGPRSSGGLGGSSSRKGTPGPSPATHGRKGSGFGPRQPAAAPYVSLMTCTRALAGVKRAHQPSVTQPILVPPPGTSPAAAGERATRRVVQAPRASAPPPLRRSLSRASDGIICGLIFGEVRATGKHIHDPVESSGIRPSRLLELP